MVENADLPGCCSLSALTYNSLSAAQEVITLRLLVLLGSVNNRWKATKLFYVFLFML
jgi:hypothetical protein